MHSPLPWRIEVGEPNPSVRDVEGSIALHNDGYYFNEDNSALVVSAVNAHDALVDALERCLGAMPEDSPLYSVTPREYEDIKSMAKYALALARS